MTASSLLLPLQSFAAFAVFDATNNVLATLQKTMDSAFQTVQKANMSTLIRQGKEDFAEQVKIYEECVKQYEESVKIYNQAVDTHNWIDTNVGNARNLKTFLSCGFSDLQNLQQLSTLLNTTMNQTYCRQSQLQLRFAQSGGQDHRQRCTEKDRRSGN